MGRERARSLWDSGARAGFHPNLGLKGQRKWSKEIGFKNTLRCDEKTSSTNLGLRIWDSSKVLD